MVLHEQYHQHSPEHGNREFQGSILFYLVTFERVLVNFDDNYSHVFWIVLVSKLSVRSLPTITPNNREYTVHKIIKNEMYVMCQ